MLTLTLIRKEASNQGTFGLLLLNTTVFFSCELPWRDNTPNYSCIPKGVYSCIPIVSPHHGLTYQIMGIPNRSHVLIHSGNVGGDTLMQYKTHTKGCILLGCKKGYIKKQKAVLLSVRAISIFNKAVNRKPFTVNIIE